MPSDRPLSPARAAVLATVLATSCSGSLDAWGEQLARATCDYNQRCVRAAFNDAYSDLNDCVEEGRKAWDELEPLLDGCEVDAKAKAKCLAAWSKATRQCETAAAEDATAACVDVVVCGGDVGDDGGGGGGTITADNFADAYAGAACEWAQACYPSSFDQTYGSVRQCKNQFAEDAGNPGGCTIDAQQAQRCLDDLEASQASCDAGEFAQIAQECGRSWDCGGGGDSGGDTF